MELSKNEKNLNDDPTVIKPGDIMFALSRKRNVDKVTKNKRAPKWSRTSQRD